MITERNALEECAVEACGEIWEDWIPVLIADKVKTSKLIPSTLREASNQ